MAAHYWRFDRDGAWENAADWTNGVPGKGDTVYIDPFGGDPNGHYTVTLSSSVNLAKLVVNSETLVEAAAGNLTASELDVTGGRLELDGVASLPMLVATGSSLVETATGSLTSSSVVRLTGGSFELDGAANLAAIRMTGSSLVEAATGSLTSSFLLLSDGSIELDGAANLATITITGSSLIEAATGSLTSSNFSLTGGSIELDGANSGLTGSFKISDATVTVSDSQAFGAATVSLSADSILRVVDDITLSLPGLAAPVVAAGGVTLTLTSTSGLLGDAADDGTIELTGAIDNSLRIGGGTVVLGAGAFSGFDLLITVGSLASGVVLDVAGQDTALGRSFTSQGEIRNSGALAKLMIETQGGVDTPGGIDTGDGTITGQFNVEIDPRYSEFAANGIFGHTGSVTLTGSGGVTVVQPSSSQAETSVELDLVGSLTVASTGSILIDGRAGNGIGANLLIAGDVQIDCPIDIESANHAEESGPSELIIEGKGVITGAITSSTFGFVGFFEGMADADGNDSLVLDGAVSNLLDGYIGSGTLVLTQANCFHNFEMYNGTVQIPTVDEFSGQIASVYGALRCLSSGTLSSDLRIGDGFEVSTDPAPSITLLSAHGQALTLSGALTNDVRTASKLIPGLVIGSGAADGTVVLDFASVYHGTATLDVAAGTLRLFENFLVSGLSFVNVTVAAGATLDLAAHIAVLDSAEIDGSIVSSVKGGVAELGDAAVTGRISGATSVEIVVPADATMSPTSVFLAAQTYQGDTTIDAGAYLDLGGGGAAGSIASKHVIDNGVLSLDRSNGLTVKAAISGSGSVEQDGAATTTLTGHNSYTGGTLVEQGVLVAKDGSRLGTGDVTVAGGELSVAGAHAIGSGTLNLAGELLERGTATIAGTIHLQGGADIAAAHGHTLTLTSAIQIEASGVLTFGDGLNNGAVLWDPVSSKTDAGTLGCRVMAGTLEVGDATAAALLTHAASVEIDSGATLDLHGFSTTLAAPSGTGSITDSGAAAVITFADVSQQIDLSFAGAIGGALTLQVTDEETLTLSGRGSFTTLELIGAREDVIDRASATILGPASESIQFDDDGIMVALGASAHLTGHIIGFGDDAIDLQGVAFGGSTNLTYAASSHTLTVTDGAHSVALVFDGTYSAADFALQNDGAGGTLVVNPDTQAAWPSRSAFPHAAPATFALGDDTGAHHLVGLPAQSAEHPEHLAIA